MRNLILDAAESAAPSILCLGAHCDDIEIGCGGTLLKTLRDRPTARVDWVIFCSSQARARETTEAAKALSIGSKEIQVHFLEFQDGYLPYEGAAAKDALKKLSAHFEPDLILTHFRNDAHQDHRIVSELTTNLFRDHLILEYEIPKYDGDLGTPNTYVSLDDAVVEEKIRIILDSFTSQAEKHWFTDDTFRSILRLRGIESGRSNRYAEAFYCRKQVISTR